MAVYRRRYQATDGPTTARRFRFLVFARYAFRELFASRVFALYFVLCFGAPLVGAVLIYLHYNPLGLTVLQTTVNELLPIDGTFFLRFLIIQTSLGSILAALIGPGLVAPDLANNALPLFLARPIGRRDYILGKLTVLLALLSVLTWIPVGLLFTLQTGLAGLPWAFANLRVGFGIVACSALWILVVSLLSLAISAWVRWRPLATLAVFGTFLASGAVGALATQILHTKWGSLLNIVKLLHFLWDEMFGRPAVPEALPASATAVAMALWCLLFLAMLLRRVRAYEVVR